MCTISMGILLLELPLVVVGQEAVPTVAAAARVRVERVVPATNSITYR